MRPSSHASGPRVVVPIDRRPGVPDSPDRAGPAAAVVTTTDARARADAGRRAGACHSAAAPTAAARIDDLMRRQEEHVHVADVVGVGEHERVAVRDAAARPADASVARATARPTSARAMPGRPICCRRSNPYRPTRRFSAVSWTPITIVERQSDLVTSNQNVLDALGQRRRRVGDLPEIGGVPQVLRGAQRRARDGEADAAARDRPAAGRRGSGGRARPAPAPAGSSSGDCQSRARTGRRAASAGEVTGAGATTGPRPAPATSGSRCRV